MPTIDDLSESKYLKKEDCGNGIVVTCDRATRENLAMQGEPPEYKWTLHFKEQGVKPLVLNKTNGTIIAHFLGTKDIDQWNGKQIELFNDPSIMFAGRMTGGIRAREPRGSQPVKRPGGSNEEQDVPFARFDPIC